MEGRSRNQGISMTRSNRTIHDPEIYKHIKTEKSAPFFKSTRVRTCSHVMMRNGKAVAIAYPLEKTGWKAACSFQNQKRSSEKESWNKNIHKKRNELHCGFARKPLCPYHPEAYRSRLAQATVVMPYKNSSQIVIGDRTTEHKTMYNSTNNTYLLNHSYENACTNGGIVAAKSKWVHYRQNK